MTTTVTPAAAHDFTSDWFSKAAGIWDALIDRGAPSRVLEIGSYEGRSACYLIEKIADQRNLTLHCVDTWEGGIEHQVGGIAYQTDHINMSDVERRFHHNTALSIGRVAHQVELQIHKGRSAIALSKLIAAGNSGYFDLVYIDGSHQAPDVLMDAVLGFELIRVGGLMIFDDYLWSEPLAYGRDPLRCPKLAIDAFTNIHSRKIEIFCAQLDQLYLCKTAN